MLIYTILSLRQCSIFYKSGERGAVSGESVACVELQENRVFNPSLKFIKLSRGI